MKLLDALLDMDLKVYYVGNELFVSSIFFIQFLTYTLNTL